MPPALQQAKSRWVPVRWAELPGLQDDALHEAWNAWLKSCERPGPALAPLCGDVRRLSLSTVDEQRAWLRERLQPYRVEPLSGATDGLLTSYFEPVFDASRTPRAGFQVPLYRPPAEPGRRAGPGTPASRSTPCPRRAPPWPGARSPGWPTRSTR